MILSTLILATQASIAPQPQGSTKATFEITHQPVDCVVADRHPRIEARIPSGVDVAAARIFFKGASQEWYSTAMKAEGATFIGVLPAPKRSLKEFHYYIEATSRTLETSRTADRATRVVTTAGDCRGIVAASAAGAASILVQGPAGAAAAPAGFAPAGLVAAGGGLSATTVAIGAAVVGGGAIAATQISGGGMTDYAGPVSGDMTLDFGGCVRVERITVTLVISLDGKGGGESSSEGGQNRVLSSTCGGGPQAGAVEAGGFPVGSVVQSGSKVSYSASETVASGDGHVDFSGTLSGSTITGTFVFTRRITLGNPPAVGVLNVPVVLNAR
ncbi:MAG: hypothetical protein K1Y01_11585 [Vicinamibacteria bacterium]|nr:hypothetical protein [Vicinamibacteria bacterium]